MGEFPPLVAQVFQLFVIMDTRRHTFKVRSKVGDDFKHGVLDFRVEPLSWLPKYRGISLLGIAHHPAFDYAIAFDRDSSFLHLDFGNTIDVNDGSISTSWSNLGKSNE